MKIEFYIAARWQLWQDYIETEDFNYVFHNDSSVTFRDIFGNCIIAERKYPSAKNIITKTLENEIFRLQKQLDIYNNSPTYDAYTQTMNK